MTIPALVLAGIDKHFGSVHAVRGADFTLNPGELHALLGENGAGKTTLMRIAAGLEQPDAGRIRVRGAELTLRSPRDARNAGIGMVHQHFTSIPAFTVRDNVALGSDAPIRPGELSATVHALNEQVGFSLDPTERAGDLPVAALQRVEILKLLAGKSSILILDEPTASLAPSDAEELLLLMRRLCERGAAAVLITHKLDEAIRFADRVTVLRRGKVTLSGPAAGKSADDLALAMLGEKIDTRSEQTRLLPGEVVASAVGVVIPPIGGKGPGIDGASFELRAGEVVGLAAVEGNGERELIRAMAGLIPVKRGNLVTSSPVALIPEDRTGEGLIADYSVTDNLTLGLGERAPWVHRGIIRRREARVQAARVIAEFGIAAPGPDWPAGWLSGGNQQKLILARALESKPGILIAENPGRGLDVRAARAAFERLRQAAKDGAGVLIYSGDLDELLGWCDRILVVAKGKVHSPDPGADRARIGRLLLAIET